LTTIYLAALAFGVTLLLASLVLGSKDTDHGHAGNDHGGDFGSWAPVTNLRFWVFLLAFGGGAGLALEQLGSSALVSALGALGMGWLAGAIAVKVVSTIKKNSVSSMVSGRELVGSTGRLLLPAGPSRIGKVRLVVKGRQEDFVATVVEDGGELATGTAVMVVAEGERGTLLVAKGEM
jgi:uncharacterized membrane protein